MSFLLDVNRYSAGFGVWLLAYYRQGCRAGKRGATFDAYMLSLCADFGQFQFPVSSGHCAELGILRMQNCALETGDW